MVKTELPWIHGPIVIDLEELHRLNHRLLDQIFARAILVTAFGILSRPYDAMAMHPTAGRRPMASLGGQVSSTNSLATYKYPQLLGAINRGVHRYCKVSH